MGGLDWGTIIWFAIVHAGCLAAPFFFTWKAVGLFFGLYWLTGGIGICLGYHRLLTHGSFQTYRPINGSSPSWAAWPAKVPPSFGLPIIASITPTAIKK